MSLLDLNDRPLSVGDFVLFCEAAGRSDATLKFGSITRINEKTKKVWVQPKDSNGHDAMRSVREIIRDSTGEPVLSDPSNRYSYSFTEPHDVPEEVRMLNHTHKGRFYIL